MIVVGLHRQPSHMGQHQQIYMSISKPRPVAGPKGRGLCGLLLGDRTPHHHRPQEFARGRGDCSGRQNFTLNSYNEIASRPIPVLPRNSVKIYQEILSRSEILLSESTEMLLSLYRGFGGFGQQMVGRFNTGRSLSVLLARFQYCSLARLFELLQCVVKITFLNQKNRVFNSVSMQSYLVFKPNSRSNRTKIL